MTTNETNQAGPGQDAAPGFEEALQRLQQTVKELEGGNLTLEQALKSFEEGVRLSRLCQEQLSAAEKKVEILTRASAEGVELAPFAGSE